VRTLRLAAILSRLIWPSPEQQGLIEQLQIIAGNISLVYIDYISVPACDGFILSRKAEEEWGMMNCRISWHQIHYTNENLRHDDWSERRVLGPKPVSIIFRYASSARHLSLISWKYCYPAEWPFFLALGCFGNLLLIDAKSGREHPNEGDHGSCGCLPGISYIKKEGHAYAAVAVSKIGERRNIGGNPSSALLLHFGQLTVHNGNLRVHGSDGAFRLSHCGLHNGKLISHDLSLLAGIASPNEDCGDTNEASKPEPQETKSLPAPIAVLLGGVFIVAAVKFLFHTLDRGGYILYKTFILGFPFFCLGGMLIFFSFLPDPPSILGFTTQHLNLF
jgi:hypothetical protein